MISRPALWMALALLTTGCDTTLTEVVVQIDTDLDVPEEVDELRIDIVEPNGTPQRAWADLRATGREGLPRTLGLVHRGGSLGPVQVEAVGRSGAEDLIVRRHRFHFVEGHTLVLQMDLLRACLEVTCEEDHTCGPAGCRPVDVDPEELRPYEPDAGFVGDAGASQDAEMPLEVPATCGGPSTLRDLFDDGELHERWVFEAGGTAADTEPDIQEGRGRLTMRPLPGPGASSMRMWSWSAVNLDDDRFSVEVVEAAPNARTRFALARGQADVLGFAVDDGVLSLELESEGVPDTVDLPFDPVEHRWWRLRENAGVVHWETSPDGKLWTSRRSAATPGFAVSASALLSVVNTEGSASPGSSSFDNLNHDRQIASFCPSSQFADTFESDEVGPSWMPSPTISGACIAEQTGGSARFTLTGVGASECEFETASAFDLRADAIYIHIPPITNSFDGLAAYLGVRDALGREARIGFRDDEYHVTWSQDGASTSVYDLSAYWRIREMGGELIFESSTDGSTWSEIERVSAPLDAGGVRSFFGVSTPPPPPSPPPSVRIHVPGYNTP